MSLTIIAFVVVVVGAVLACAFGFATIDYPILGLIAGIFAAVALGALVVAIGSYNNNTGETANREKASCIEDGGKIILGAPNLCLTEESQVIRKIN